MNSLKNRGILIKGTARKITNQKGGLPNFLRPLMTACLPLMKNVFTPLAKSIFIPLGLKQQHQQQMQLFKIKFIDQAQQH